MLRLVKFGNICALCAVPATSTCAKCKMVYYCCREHQAQDFKIHKLICKSFSNASEIFQREENLLINMDNGNPFEYNVGNFWLDFDTRDYMRAKYGRISTLERFGSYKAVTFALEEMLDCLRLCRGDNMGIRDLIPALQLRLHRDQECFDFIKWWSTTGSEPDYDWGDADLPYLDLHNEDSFELIMGDSLHHCASLLLLKIRMLKTLENSLAWDTFLLGTHLRIGKHSKVGKLSGNYGPLSVIHSYLPDTSSTVPCRRKLREKGGTLQLINDTKLHIASIMRNIDRSNPRVLKSLVNPLPLLRLPQATSYSPGSTEEAQIVWRSIQLSWLETPGSIEILMEKYGNCPIYDIN